MSSGVVEGSVMGPDLSSIRADSLMHGIWIRRVADDFKFIGDVALHSRSVIQTEIDIVANWLAEYKMLLSVEKSLVMHSRSHQPNYEYSLNDCKMKCGDSLTDQGVQRFSINLYSGHYKAVAFKAAKVAGAIKHL